MVKALRLRLANAAALGDFDDADELTKEADCIGEIILALGGKKSSKPGKTFSIPSDEQTFVGAGGAHDSGDAFPDLSEPPAKTG